MQDADWVHTYIDGRDLVDLFTDFPSETFKAENLHQLLRKLPPREYSIASSYKANPDEVHITVGAVRYHAHGRDRSGVCSVQLAERVQPGDTIPIYLKKNPNFKFPTDETPVIMIGPGTGVAPFRAYMQEREELGLESKTWLFFGEQHFTTDFLYQTEWQEWLKDDVLTKLDLAFSRDTDEKVYVQHRIAEHSATFYEWLMNGAALYVCGDEKQMAKDVHQTIRYVLEQEGGMSETEAEAYLTEMKKKNVINVTFIKRKDDSMADSNLNFSEKLDEMERIKTESNYLRGTIEEGLADRITGAIAEEDTKLLKFHGSYMQDDRDLRDERRKQKLEPAYSFMIRVRAPGGASTPEQWIAMDDIANEYANHTIKLTTRQAFQFHGILKRNLKQTMFDINQSLLDTLAACGDVNRNVMSNPNPYQSDVHAEVNQIASDISAHLSPRTQAYHEIWLDGEK